MKFDLNGFTSELYEQFQDSLSFDEVTQLLEYLTTPKILKQLNNELQSIVNLLFRDIKLMFK